jgi:hypothetical protein
VVAYEKQKDMNDVQQNKMNMVQEDQTNQQAQQFVPQPAPQPVPQPDPTMNPYSNGTGSARPNISETDANNLNQFRQGVNMGASLFGIKKAKADVMKTQAMKDKIKQ